jgi:hypothetical protein
MKNPAGKKMKWSPLLTFYIFSALTLIISLLVFMLMKYSMLAELEIITGLISLLIFLFLGTALYHGVVFDKNEKITVNWTCPNLNMDNPLCGIIDTGGAFTMAGAEAGPGGFIVGILVDIIVSFLLVAILAFLLWLGINAAIATFAIIMLPLFFLFKRSLRIVVAKGRGCRANLAKTLVYSFAITVLYTGWFYAILFTAHLLSRIGR